MSESDHTLRSFDESLPMALLRAREAAMRLFRPLLAEHDLTEQQWRVLRALTAEPDALEVGEIATATFLLAPSLSRILSNLEGRELVDRQPVAHDQRRSAISLTAAGRELVALISPHSEAIYARIESAFGSVALGELLADLDKLRTAMETA